ncbi:MAG: ureidoglycolate lyase [Rhodovibrio sp.]|nr:ureidoglycolate lyase [Rhodovibrio sp.]
MLERHPLGDQLFWPLSNDDWLVVVAAGETPRPGDCRCFRARGDQGVRYAANVLAPPAADPGSPPGLPGPRPPRAGREPGRNLFRRHPGGDREVSDRRGLQFPGR